MDAYAFLAFKYDEKGFTGYEEVTLNVLNYEEGDAKWQEYDTSVLDCSKYGRIESLDLYVVWKLLQEFSPVYKCCPAREMRILYLDFMLRHGLVSIISPMAFCRSLRGEYLLAELMENPPKPRTVVFPQEYNQRKLEFPDKWDLHTNTDHRHQRRDSYALDAEYNIREGTCLYGGISNSGLRVPCLQVGKSQSDKHE